MGQLFPFVITVVTCALGATVFGWLAGLPDLFSHVVLFAGMIWFAGLIGWLIDDCLN